MIRGQGTFEGLGRSPSIHPVGGVRVVFIRWSDDPEPKGDQSIVGYLSILG